MVEELVTEVMLADVVVLPTIVLVLDVEEAALEDTLTTLVELATDITADDVLLVVVVDCGPTLVLRLRDKLREVAD